MRSLLRPIALLVVPLLALTACGSGSEVDPGIDAPGSQAEAGAFPVTIKNKFGDTKLVRSPQRVVTVGLVEQAVGKPKQADELVKGIEKRFDTVRAEPPEFQGKQALMATPWQGYFIYGTQDPRSRLLTDFGFSLPSGLDKVIGDKFGGNISAERISILDQQALVWFPTKGGTAKLKADPLYKNLKVRSEGRDVFVEENYDALYGATSFVSVLSLPIVLDQLVPKLSKAVDGDPATNA